MMTSSDDEDFKYFFPHVRAVYRDHPNPEYIGHPFISCLEFFPDDASLTSRLETLPHFDESQRSQAAAVRLTYVSSLSRIFIALARTLALVRGLSNLMLEGYVPRRPLTVAGRKRMQELYEARLNQTVPGMGTGAWGRDSGAELSTAFIGVAGCGKSATIKALDALYPPVIHHADLSIWQVPILVFELPTDGRSMHGLATAIIDALDKRLPFCDYGNLYLRKGKKNALERLYDAIKLLHIHAVGLLVADESQSEGGVGDFYSAKKGGAKTKTYRDGEAPLISLLIAASNRLRIPLVLVGTNELHEVMGGRMSRCRRSVGHGMEYWGFLERSGNVRMPGEFEVLLRRLWKYQWVSKPVKLNDARANQFFELTQGNADLIVKLFVSAQTKAINEGIEELTPELILATYEKEFKPVIDPMRAQREQDPEKLARYADIAPIGLRDGAGFSSAAIQMHRENMQRKGAAAKAGNDAGEPAPLAAKSAGVKQKKPRKPRTVPDAPVPNAPVAEPVKVSLPSGFAEVVGDLEVRTFEDLDC